MMKTVKTWCTLLIILPLSASLLFVSLFAASAVSHAMTATLVGFILAPRTTIDSQMPAFPSENAVVGARSQSAAASLSLASRSRRLVSTWNPGRYRQINLLIAEGFIQPHARHGFSLSPWPEFGHPWNRRLPTPVRKSGG